MISKRINFQCLENKDVIDSRLTDHDPLLVDTPYGKVCYFNIMCQCDKTRYGFNNAFKLKENDEQYKKRLQDIIKVLVELQKMHGVVGFMLQEAPQPGADHSFYHELGEQLIGFNIDGKAFARKTAKTRACTFSAFDKNVFPKQKPGDFSTDGRDQVFQLIARDGGLVTVLNVHGDYTAQDATAKLICDAIKKGLIAGGDLNISENSQAHTDVVDACRGIAGTRVCIESTRAFPQATIDVAICNYSPQMKATHGGDDIVSSSLPVVKSIKARQNPNLYDFTFNSEKDSQYFANLLADKGIVGLDGKPLTTQKDGVTIIVAKEKLSTAEQCCQQAHSAKHGVLFQTAAATPSLPVLDSVKQRANKDLSDYKFKSAEDAMLFSELLFNQGVKTPKHERFRPQQDGVTIIVHKDNYSIADQCCRSSESSHAHKLK